MCQSLCNHRTAQTSLPRHLTAFLVPTTDRPCRLASLNCLSPLTVPLQLHQQHTHRLSLSETVHPFTGSPSAQLFLTHTGCMCAVKRVKPGTSTYDYTLTSAVLFFFFFLKKLTVNFPPPHFLSISKNSPRFFDYCYCKHTANIDTLTCF